MKSFIIEIEFGLGERFIEAIEEAAARVVAFPQAGSPYVANTRRVFTKRFPFSVIYRVQKEEIVIFAIAHHAQKPGYWRSRLISRQDLSLITICYPENNFLQSSNYGLKIFFYISHHIGGAAALLGRYEAARNHNQEAIRICTEMRFRPELALSRLQLAELLLEQYPQEKSEAIADRDSE